MPRRKQEQNRDRTIKECSITVRISQELKEKLRRAAIKRGKTISDYINYLLLHRIPEPDEEEKAPDLVTSEKWKIIESPASILRKTRLDEQYKSSVCKIVEAMENKAMGLKSPDQITKDIRKEELERLRNTSTALQFQRDDGEITAEEYERKQQENAAKIRQWYKNNLQED